MNESFSFYVQRYFMSYLMKQHNYGANTISSYRDTFKLLLSFIATSNTEVSKMIISDLDHDKVIEFITWLGEIRKNGVATKNVRLA
ncbi:MAG: site-specific integrase, partial [Butyrivibrio sp.]